MSRSPKYIALCLFVTMSLCSVVRCLRVNTNTGTGTLGKVCSLMLSNSNTRLLSTNTGNAVGAQPPRVLVPVADGSEEIESVTIIDTLVRGGALVTVASVASGPSKTVTCSRGVKIEADKFIRECVGQHFDMIVCPGGMPGAEHLRDSADLTGLLKTQNAAGKWVGAICAAPAVVLATHGLLVGKRATCYPAPKFQTVLPNLQAAEEVVVDNNIVTSQGPATALKFSLKLVEILMGTSKAESVAKEMITTYP